MAANWSENPAYSAPQMRMAGGAFAMPGRSEGSKMPGAFTAGGQGGAGISSMGAEEVAKTQGEALKDSTKTTADAMVNATGIRAGADTQIAGKYADAQRDAAGINAGVQNNWINAQANMHNSAMQAQGLRNVADDAFRSQQLQVQRQQVGTNNAMAWAQVGLGALKTIGGFIPGVG